MPKESIFIKTLLNDCPHILMEAIGEGFTWYKSNGRWCMREISNYDTKPAFKQLKGETFPSFVKRVSSVLVSMKKIETNSFQNRILAAILAA